MPKILPESEDVGFWLKTLSNHMEAGRNQRMSEFELTSSQFEVLMFLVCQDEDEVNQIDIEQAMNRSNPTITGIVKRLEAKGFIERLPSCKDKRYKKLVVTEKGCEFVKGADINRRRGEEELLRGFSDDERKQLISFIKRLDENVRLKNNEKGGLKFNVKEAD
ncbi:MAG: MarR family transcriptional regulator [Eubacterium sp.]|nr:MarR family transcriptional regulator [Eubacterium sp.]